MAEVPSDLDPSPLDPRHQRLEALVRDYARLVRHAVRSVARRHTQTVLADVEQTVFLAIWQQVRREQTIDHPASYLYQAAVRETVRALRKAPVVEAGTERAVEWVDGPRTPEDLTLAAERREHVRAAVAALPAERARAVRAHLRGFTVQEVMELYGWDYHKARNLIARGMADLRTGLREKGVE